MKGIRKIAPYVPGMQPTFPDMIKINTNENAYPPSPLIAEALEKFEADTLKRYSSLEVNDVREQLAENYNLKKENFLIGNGSDEILAWCFLAFFNSNAPVLFPDITYGFYKVWADLFHIPFEEIPLDENFEIDFTDYEKENGGIIIANPNAPTGIYKDFDVMRKFIHEHDDSIVIVDEAYVHFGGQTLAPLIDECDNLVIVHTLSKSVSLAGLRVGFAIASTELIEVLGAIKSSFNPYSVDRLAETIAAAALADMPYYHVVNENIQLTRDEFVDELAELGFKTLPSKANLILTTHENISMEKLYNDLADEHIFVRYFSSPERLANYLRISIGTSEEMERVLEVIKEKTV
jgi:histidinol-phosphate aminotransferase